MGEQYEQYKDSGFEWQGEIPSHWNMAKIKHIASIVNGSTPDSAKDAYWESDVVWITPTDLGKLNGNYVNDSARKITELGLNSCGTSIAPAGSVILTTRAPIGNLCITEVDACTNQGCKYLIVI